jgi:hypothetical protein
MRCHTRRAGLNFIARKLANLTEHPLSPAYAQKSRNGRRTLPFYRKLALYQYTAGYDVTLSNASFKGLPLGAFFFPLELSICHSLCQKSWQQRWTLQNFLEKLRQDFMGTFEILPPDVVYPVSTWCFPILGLPYCLPFIYQINNHRWHIL